MIDSEVEIRNVVPRHLVGRISLVDDVTSNEREQMFALMQANYRNVTRDDFQRDFCAKDWAIIASDPDTGRVFGFSTQTLDEQVVDSRLVRVLYSGDTIVDRRFWANNPLAGLWGQLALSLIDAHDDAPLYWFLISKGYKTYRFLPVFFREYYPRHETPTPAWAGRLISEFSTARFGDRFCESSGIVRSPEKGCRLRESVAAVTEERLKNSHIAFFVNRNPGHVNGDELCCIAPLTRENLNERAFRVIGLRNGHPSRG